MVKKCGKKRDTLEEFIKKAILKHGTKYDYSKVVYLGTHIKVCIICPEHGEFWQKPNRHLVGNGCQKCAVDKRTSISVFNLEQFIEKAKAVHGDKYDYSKAVYINIKTKITIICHVHGEFDQTPNSHLQGYGCNKCGIESTRSHVNDFIQKAKKLHDNRYDYSMFIYKNSKVKGNIKCNVCNYIFNQTPADHLQGYGCPMCKASKGELALESIFKKHNIMSEPQYRIPEVVEILKYDFYLPDYNLLIEFHGKQHYEWIQYFHKTEDNFLKQKDRDRIIRHNAHYWKYHLLEFNYKQLKQLSQEQFEKFVISEINKFKKKG